MLKKSIPIALLFIFNFSSAAMEGSPYPSLQSTSGEMATGCMQGTVHAFQDPFVFIGSAVYWIWNHTTSAESITQSLNQLRVSLDGINPDMISRLSLSDLMIQGILGTTHYRDVFARLPRAEQSQMACHVVAGLIGVPVAFSAAVRYGPEAIQTTKQLSELGRNFTRSVGEARIYNNPQNLSVTQIPHIRKKSLATQNLSPLKDVVGVEIRKMEGTYLDHPADLGVVRIDGQKVLEIVVPKPLLTVEKVVIVNPVITWETAEKVIAELPAWYTQYVKKIIVSGENIKIFVIIDGNSQFLHFQVTKMAQAKDVVQAIRAKADQFINKMIDDTK